MKFVLGRCEERNFEEDLLEVIGYFNTINFMNKIIVVFVLAICGIFSWIKKREFFY